MVSPGEIYWANLPEAARRPVVIVSRSSLNRGNQVLVIPLTTAKLELRRHLPNCVPFAVGEFGLPKACVAQAEKLTTLNLVDMDLNDAQIGQLDEQRLRDLIRAVGHVLDADCEPV